MSNRQQWISGSKVGLLGAVAVAVGAVPAGAQTTAPPAGSLPQLTPTPSAESSAPVPSAKPAKAKKQGGAKTVGSRQYYIRRGDNLWVISRDRLGGKASKADVQRYLVRIWNLNKQRMRTEQPDVIPMHVTITLPAVK